MTEIPYMMTNTRAEFERVRDLAWPVTDRTAATDAEFRDRIAPFESAPTPPEVVEARVIEEVEDDLASWIARRFQGFVLEDIAWDTALVVEAIAAAVPAYRAAQEGGAEEAVRRVRDLVHHIARMHDRWADMGAEDPDARNRELWAPLHRKADAVRDLLPGEAL